MYPVERSKKISTEKGPDVYSIKTTIGEYAVSRDIDKYIVLKWILKKYRIW